MTQVQCDFGNVAGRWGIGRSSFREGGLPHNLLVVADLTQPLRAEELQAWQRLGEVAWTVSDDLGAVLAEMERPPATLVGAVEALVHESLQHGLGEQTVHEDVSFTVKRGTLVALIGGSGTGKSVLLREIIGLQRPTSGRIRLLGTDVWASASSELDVVRRRFGMMFQDGALFSSLTVAQNVAVPLIEHATVPPALNRPQKKASLEVLGIYLLSTSQATSEKMPMMMISGFQAKALTEQQVGQLLWAAQGVTDPATGHRAAPSAMAMYPLTVYVFRADGVFSFEPKGHKLVRLQDQDRRAEVTQPARGGEAAPVTFIFTGDRSKMGTRMAAMSDRFISG